MRTSLRLLAGLATICLSAGFTHAQTDDGFPLCKEDGSIPEGYNECDCPKPPITYRVEFNDAQRDFRVQLPHGVLGIGVGCAPGHTFGISLTRPRSEEPGGDFPWNEIRVWSSEDPRKTLYELADGWAKDEREDSERIHATDVVIDEPNKTPLSSLVAVHLRMTRTELEHGKMIYEAIIAKNPNRDIVYEIGMVSPANRYQKNRRLLDAVVDGFRYVPEETKTTN